MFQERLQTVAFFSPLHGSTWLNSSSAHHPRGQKQNRTHQRKHSTHGDSNQTQREGYEPNNWQKNRREQSHRPAQDEKDAPTNKKYEHLHERILPLLGESSTKDESQGRNIKPNQDWRLKYRTPIG
jgi:hypothetical protein